MLPTTTEENAQDRPNIRDLAGLVNMRITVYEGTGGIHIWACVLNLLLFVRYSYMTVPLAMATQGFQTLTLV